MTLTWRAARLPLVVLLAGGALSTVANAGTIVPKQLRGLDRIELQISIGEGPLEALRRRREALDSVVKSRLKKMGLTATETSLSRLCLVVEVERTERALNECGTLVRVRLSLSEAVTVRRDPSIELPGGAITWSQDRTRFAESGEIDGPIIELTEGLLSRLESDLSLVRTFER